MPAASRTCGRSPSRSRSAPAAIRAAPACSARPRRPPPRGARRDGDRRLADARRGEQGGLRAGAGGSPQRRRDGAAPRRSPHAGGLRDIARRCAGHDRRHHRLGEPLVVPQPGRAGRARHQRPLARRARHGGMHDPRGLPPAPAAARGGSPAPCRARARRGCADRAGLARPRAALGGRCFRPAAGAAPDRRCGTAAPPPARRRRTGRGCRPASRRVPDPVPWTRGCTMRRA